jgi:hypothetical protein
MKKSVLAAVVALVLVFPSASWAGSRSELLSEGELNQIEAFAQSVYDWKGKVQMEPKDEWPLGRFVTIQFRGRHNWQYISLDVYPVGVVRNPRIGCNEISETEKKITKFIWNLLNEPARQALK